MLLRVGPDQQPRIVSFRDREGRGDQRPQPGDKVVERRVWRAKQDDRAIAKHHRYTATPGNFDGQRSNTERLVAFERPRVQTLPEQQGSDRHDLDRTRGQLGNRRCACSPLCRLAPGELHHSLRSIWCGAARCGAN